MQLLAAADLFVGDSAELTFGFCVAAPLERSLRAIVPLTYLEPVVIVLCVPVMHSNVGSVASFPIAL